MERGNGEEIMKADRTARRAGSWCQLLNLPVQSSKMGSHKFRVPVRSGFLFWGHDPGIQKLWWWGFVASQVFATAVMSIPALLLAQIIFLLNFELSLNLWEMQGLWHFQAGLCWVWAQACVASTHCVRWMSWEMLAPLTQGCERQWSKSWDN